MGWGGGGAGGVGVHLPGCQLISELLPLSSSKGAVRALSNCHSSLQLIDPFLPTSAAAHQSTHHDTGRDKLKTTMPATQLSGCR